MRAPFILQCEAGVKPAELARNNGVIEATRAFDAHALKVTGFCEQ